MSSLSDPDMSSLVEPDMSSLVEPDMVSLGVLGQEQGPVVVPGY